jgi:hypothetical protein
MNPKNLSYPFSERLFVFPPSIHLAQNITQLLELDHRDGIQTLQHQFIIELGAYPVSLPDWLGNSRIELIKLADTLVTDAWFAAKTTVKGYVTDWNRIRHNLCEAQITLHGIYNFDIGNPLILKQKRKVSAYSSTLAKQALAKIEPFRLSNFYLQ